MFKYKNIPIIQNHYPRMKTSLRKANWNTLVFFFLFTNLTLPFFSSQVEASALILNQTGLKSFQIKGYILDSENKKPVDFARVAILDPIRTTYSDTFGYFELNDIDEGVYILQIYRIGYRNSEVEITVYKDSSNTFTFELLPRPVSSETVIVTGKREAETETVIGTAIYQMTGEKLRQSLGLSIAETIDGEPGMSQRSMGPAPARPVLRGLGGDRLLLLEDGSRTGDLSATSNDHAVALDPLNADQIEVYRGPEALQFGSNTLAGVINVWNRNIPTTLPQKTNIVTTVQTETVNSGIAGGFHGSSAWKKWALTYSGSGRNVGNTNTPDGILKNTELDNYRLSGGISTIQPWGFIGSSVSLFKTNYGIPGGFIGAHPNGVDISSDRKQAEIRYAYQFSSNSWLHHIDGNYNYTEYYHREYESSGLLGVLFGVLTYSGNLKLHTNEHALGKSTFGIWGQYRDYANGGFVFTPNTIESEIAGYWYNEKNWNKWRFETALRLDYKRINPLEEGYSRSVGIIRDRDFMAWSGAAEIEYFISDHFSMGTRFMKTFRAPGLEELFSEGPHLAAYSYEIGSADNKEETGIGTDLFFSLTTDRIHGSLSLYRNQILNYLFPKDIDSLNIAKLLPIYQFVGQNALFYGTELHLEMDLSPNLNISANSSYTWAELTDFNQPVPFIPPLQGKMMMAYKLKNYHFNLNSRFAAAQNRTGEFEEPTDGFILFGAGLEYIRTVWGSLNVFSIKAENLFNTTYRNHLSRVKSVMPEPGFNFSVIYRVYL